MSMVYPHLDSQASMYTSVLFLYTFFIHYICISIRADRWSCELSESEMS